MLKKDGEDVVTANTAAQKEQGFVIDNSDENAKRIYDQLIDLTIEANFNGIPAKEGIVKIMAEIDANREYDPEFCSEFYYDGKGWLALARRVEKLRELGLELALDSSDTADTVKERLKRNPIELGEWANQDVYFEALLNPMSEDEYKEHIMQNENTDTNNEEIKIDGAAAEQLKANLDGLMKDIEDVVQSHVINTKPWYEKAWDWTMDNKLEIAIAVAAAGTAYYVYNKITSDSGDGDIVIIDNESYGTLVENESYGVNW